MNSQPAWIVVAEDNAPDVFLIREALKEAGLSCRLDTISDGDDAFRLIDRLEGELQGRLPDIFLIDLNLPKRSGSEILSRVRASPRGGEIAVIVMSSSDAPSDRALARSLGADLYFHKPSELGEFMKIGGHIRALLGEDKAKPPM